MRLTSENFLIKLFSVNKLQYYPVPFKKIACKEEMCTEQTCLSLNHFLIKTNIFYNCATVIATVPATGC